ncbi:unnamed protein product [Owenia fusiformis]|uniref:Uncharacterized protein n=1 Tax=Owenia fusiformis TaxID=6347 RepID=A0A8J1UM07_OWEFU|nr:unnamed protein product [Owenia fusiformis]
MTKTVKMSTNNENHENEAGIPMELKSQDNGTPTNSNHTNSNHTNTASSTSDELSEAACNALDIVGSKQEQSYDNFLKSFTYLHKDDITKQLIKTQEKMFHESLNGNAEEHTNNTEENDVEVEDIDSDEMIETLNEVLPGAPSTSGVMVRAETPGSIVKLDNFVQDESNHDSGEDVLDIDLGDDEAPYLPDFSDTNTTPRGGTTILSPRIRDLSLSPPQSDPQFYDSAGVPIIPEEPHNDLSESNDDELEIKIPDTVTNYPGEIETVQISPRACDIQRVRQLDFSTQSYKVDHSDPPQLNNTGTENSEVIDVKNDVEAFSLDTDFDYDNVVLTPKYTAEEMEMISQGFANRNDKAN